MNDKVLIDRHQAVKNPEPKGTPMANKTLSKSFFLSQKEGAVNCGQTEKGMPRSLGGAGKNKINHSGSDKLSAAKNIKKSAADADDCSRKKPLSDDKDRQYSTQNDLKTTKLDEKSMALHKKHGNVNKPFPNESTAGDDGQHSALQENNGKNKQAQARDTNKEQTGNQTDEQMGKQTDEHTGRQSIAYVVAKDPEALARYIEDSPQAFVDLISQNHTFLQYIGSDTESSKKLLSGIIDSKGAEEVIGAVASSGALSNLSGKQLEKSVKHLCGDAGFMNAVLSDERIRAGIIAGYLDGLVSSGVPKTIPGVPSGAFALSAPARPKSLKEAGDMARRMIKLY